MEVRPPQQHVSPTVVEPDGRRTCCQGHAGLVLDNKLVLDF